MNSFLIKSPFQNRVQVECYLGLNQGKYYIFLGQNDHSIVGE